MLNDEVLTLNLELNAITQRNAALQADNASLLQRWIDKMNMTAEEMNEEFERETGSTSTSTKSGAGAGLGKEVGKAGDGTAPGDFQAGGRT